MDFLTGLATRAAELTPVEAALTRHCFRALLAGAPATTASLPAALGVPPREIDAALGVLTTRGPIAVAAGAVTVASGLSLPPTAHRVTFGKTVRHVCCAVDALGIPAGLRRPADVDSRCHACGGPVRARVEAGTVTAAPASLVIWAADLDPARSVREYT